MNHSTLSQIETVSDKAKRILYQITQRTAELEFVKRSTTVKGISFTYDRTPKEIEKAGGRAEADICPTMFVGDWLDNPIDDSLSYVITNCIIAQLEDKIDALRIEFDALTI